MAEGPISWLSKKQAIVALSTSEAEYVSVSAATQERQSGSGGYLRIFKQFQNGG